MAELRPKPQASGSSQVFLLFFLPFKSQKRGYDSPGFLEFVPGLPSSFKRKRPLSGFYIRYLEISMEIILKFFKIRALKSIRKGTVKYPPVCF